MINKAIEREEIIVNIASKRMKLVKEGEKKGLTDQETIKISEELDQLLNRYMEVS